jgi:hypothetical protein
MFRLDQASNRIAKLKPVRFADLGFGERTHLQEWIAYEPEALGEELLVIQKEFAGFDDTKERLDLLALDKKGVLVIIENKLDDSGRDVVWQCLKYASYCSGLTKAAIAEMFQQYLEKHALGGRAEEHICDFLEKEDFSEVILNPGNQQRLILVAAQFRKEVTSTILWLLKHGLRLQCFKATPFRHGDQVFLTLDQVIPLPEAEEFMIGVTAKEKEEQATGQGQIPRYNLRTDFWHQTLEALENAGVKLYGNVSPSKDHWLNAGSGLGGVHYCMIFSTEGVRVEFVFAHSKERNKVLFDGLSQQKTAIEKAFGSTMEWRRMDDNIKSMVVYGKSFDGYDRENWPAMINWLVDHMKKMEKAFEPHIDSLRKLAKVRFAKSSLPEDDES